MKKYLSILALGLAIVILNIGNITAQQGIRFPKDKKLPEVKIYSSGKVEQFYVKAMDRLKAGQEPTAVFDITYHGFTEEAKTAFAKAVELWSYLFKSTVPIKIDASWEALDQGVLGSAGASSYMRDFRNAPYPLTWYPIALANKLAGFDNNPEIEDIHARFSSSVSWYYGLDGNCPVTKYDLISVVMHEIGHGLGFIGSAEVDGTLGSWGSGTGLPFVFDQFVFNTDDELLIDTLKFNNPSTALKTQYTSGKVVFQSELSDAADNGIHASLYAPTLWDDGSSYSHLADKYNGTVNALMTYSVGKGEVEHHPGPITLGMFAEMGWTSLLFVHKPVKDLEAMVNPIDIETKIVSDSSLVAGSVYLHYSTDNFTTDNKLLMNTTNDTMFTATIPVVIADTVKYYLEASTSLNRKYYYPVQYRNQINEIDSTFYFKIGNDTIDPILEHTPLKSIFNFENNLALKAYTDDNQSIDSVYIEYQINNGSLTTIKCDSIEFNNASDLYLYTSNIPVGNLNDNDTIYYRVVSVDKAAISNKKYSPETDFHKVVVIELAAAQRDMVVSFDQTEDDGLFYKEGLTIGQPTGFTTKGLHSPHPYEEGDDYPTDDITYSALLKVPVVLNESDAYLKFDEIVIVEPGEVGTVYGDDEFWDYVVVEGSVDSAKTWVPFENGYDSRIYSIFLSRYNNEQDGTESIFRSHKINLLSNTHFSGNDTVLIRFRLYSDQLSAGWGWAIDNLQIQGSLTSAAIAAIEQIDFKVFPSPSNGNFDVELTTEESIQDYSLKLYDIDGKLIFEKTKPLSGNRLTEHLNISSNPSGMYFLKLKYNDKVITKKILKN